MAADRETRERCRDPRRAQIAIPSRGHNEAEWARWRGVLTGYSSTTAADPKLSPEAHADEIASGRFPSSVLPAD
jgi:hypothetical protein